MPNHIVKEAGGDYLQGEATVTLEGGKIVVVFTEDNKRYMDVTMEKIPEGLVSGDKYQVRLNSTGTEMYSIRPVKCTAVAVFERFTAKKDEPPQPKVQQGGPRNGSKGTWYAKDKLIFTALFKIVSKKYRGMEIAYPLDYTFKQWENSTDTVIPTGSKNKDKVVTFLETTGWDAATDEIPYSENVLPFLEKLLKARNKQVLLAVNDKGYIDSLSPFSNDLEV